MISPISATGPYDAVLQDSYLTAADQANRQILASPDTDAQSNSVTPAVIIALSPQAQSGFSEQQSSLLSSSATSLLGPPSASSEIPVQTTAADESAGTTSAGDLPDSAPSLEQMMSMTAAEWFYATTAVQELVAGLTPDQASAFEAAYNTRTLYIESASGIPQLNSRAIQIYQRHLSAGGGNSAVPLKDLMTTQGAASTSFVYADPFFGELFISWGAPPSATR